MRAVELDGAPLDDAFRDTMETCVQCRGCEAACPSSVPFGHLIEGTHEALASPTARLAAQPCTAACAASAEWFALRRRAPAPPLLLALTWRRWVGQRLHLVPRRFGLPRLSPRSLRTPLRADPDADATLFTGCVMDAWQRDVHRAALRRDARHRARASGSPAAAATAAARCTCTPGRVDEARRLARRVIRVDAR